MGVRQSGRTVIVDFAIVSGASAAALLVMHAVTFAIGRRIGRYNVVDVAWGLGFIAVAAIAAILRLSWYIHRRSAGQGEDRARTSFFIPRPPRSAQNDDRRR
jgi:steroid 5-alpha reductase family enzyme